MKHAHPVVVATAVEMGDTIREEPRLNFSLYRFADRERTALASAIPATKRAVAARGISMGDIDLIVSLSLSPNAVAYDRAICGPRLCHPLQKEVGAANAWCIDVADSSVDAALELAWAYLLNSGKQFAVIVRSEIVSGITPCPETGFLWSEGAGAILLENSADPPPGSLSAAPGARVEMPADLSPCCMLWNDEIASAEDPLGLLDFPADSIAACRQALARFVDSEAVVADVRAEDWLGGACAMGKPPPQSGPLSLFEWLSASLVGDGTTTIAFNPFRLELSALHWRRM